MTDFLWRNMFLYGKINLSNSFRYVLAGTCFYLEFSITLLGVTEPLEERMEQAFFSPPLSKQRVEYAVQHIRDSGATSLVKNTFISLYGVAVQT